MTTIRIDLIRPSPHPVRTSWDEDKLNELSASIAEQGVIVPVKVRRVGDTPCECGYDGDYERWTAANDLFEARHEYGEPRPCAWCEWLWEMEGEDAPEKIAEWQSWPPAFELVYGHRRVEAARRAGLIEVPAIIEGVDDTRALIQALIENVQREDMQPMDTARALRALMDATGWSATEVARRGIMPADTVGYFLALLRLPEDVQAKVARAEDGRNPPGTVTAYHVQQVQRSGVSEDLGATALRKATREDLTAAQTRRVAEAVAAAPDERTRQALLDAPYSPAVHDRETAKDRERLAGAVAFAARKTEPSWDRAAAQMIEDADRFGRTVDRWTEALDAGVVSPEAQKFIARRIAPHLTRMSALVERMTNAD